MALAPSPPSGPLPTTLLSWNSALELLLAGLCLLCALILFGYFSYGHYQTRSLARRSPVRRSLWTTDQINACLIPLGLAMAFIVAYLIKR